MYIFAFIVYYIRKEMLNLMLHCVFFTQKIWSVFVFFIPLRQNYTKRVQISINLNNNYYEYF